MKFKTIDKFLIKAFLPPFFVSFFVGLFVLLMQSVWVYIDDIMGKGAGLLFISEMILYLSIYLIPLALIIGILIASVMVVGGLAEKYELSSMKSAGISLFRVILPMAFLCASLGVFSYFSSNYLQPLAKLKYNARLYDIRRQKPTLAIEEGVFNDNFPGYTLRIGKKEADNKTIKDVMIYQQTANGNVNEVLAKDGIMFATEDKQYMVMRLNEGERYESLKADEKRRFAFVRTKFTSWNKVFELAALERTDENLFKNSQSTKSVARLSVDIDSIGKKYWDRRYECAKQVETNFTIYSETLKDTTKSYIVKLNEKAEAKNVNIPVSGLAYTYPVPQNITKPLNEMRSFFFTFPVNERNTVLSQAKASAETLESQSRTNAKSLDRIRENQAKHICEMHTKFGQAMMCLVFLFVGAPMGAIVRKGGFGFPILIAIGFFIAYIFLYLMFRKLAEQGSIEPVFSMWLPVLLMSVLGIFLTYKAMRDESIFDSDRLLKIKRFLVEKSKRLKIRKLNKVNS